MTPTIQMENRAATCTRTLIRTTHDGRQVEVIGSAVCLDGAFEADTLTPLAEHPNARDIQRAAPGTTHMAGRLALDAAEVAAVYVALAEARQSFDMSPGAIAERIRNVTTERQRLAGIE